MLTKDQKKAAIFARSVDTQPDYYGKPGHKEQAVYDYEFANGYAEDEQGRDDREARKRLAQEAADFYKTGVAVLKEFTLTWTDKRPLGVGLMDTEIAGADDWLTVDAGYIATAAQQATAIFKKRK